MTKLKPKKLKKTNLIQKNTQPYTLNSKDVYGMISGPTWSQIYVNVLRGKLNSVHFVGGISRQIILHNTLTSFLPVQYDRTAVLPGTSQFYDRFRNDLSNLNNTSLCNYRVKKIYLFILQQLTWKLLSRHTCTCRILSESVEFYRCDKIFRL